MFEFIKKLFRLGKVESEIAVVDEQAKKVTRRVKKIVDINNDNVINLEDVKEVKKRVSKKVKEVADVNRDGKVDIEDVKEAVKKVSTRIKPTPPQSVIKQEIAESVKPKPKPTNKKRGRKPKAKAK